MQLKAGKSLTYLIMNNGNTNFGGDEEAMAMSAKIVEVVNPDLVDINFGCP